jgi:DNA-binding MarR family transcriptional regulator/GNAT superfamily N-acetyltransferase
MPGLHSDITAARRFARFYTRQADLLDEAFLESPYSLTEGRVLYELAHRDGVAAADLGRDLGLDRGYLSRILKTFEAKGLLERRTSLTDGRRQLLGLTPVGRAVFSTLDRVSQKQWVRRLGPLGDAGRGRLVDAMSEIERLMGSETAPPPIVLRDHGIGDLGWVARRQGQLYAEEYGWDSSFEALVAEILVGFVRTHDPAKEHGWIAERGGDILGSVYCMRVSDEEAKLRLLYVEPAARGTGLGARFVGTCIAFARERGYRRLTLWTNDCLSAALHIYRRAGFTLVEEEHHRSFGHDLVGQYWRLDL